jgi:enediyne biosynthesis protein E5
MQLAIRPRREVDPRHLQVLSLGILLGLGLAVLGFDQTPAAVALIMATALATQWAFTRLYRLPAFDQLSPFITSLSLSILLRAAGPQWLILAAFVAIASKFVIRVDGAHVFNPANLGICTLILLGEGWISPAQWGSRAYFVFLAACLGSLVLTRAKRADISLAFLASYAAILFGRALYLGDPWAIPMKQLQSGALLLFAFFMITDPKTTPKQRTARIAYAVLVAALAGWLQFAHWRPDCLMIALVVTSPLVPLINRLGTATRAKPLYDWSRPTA